MPRGVYDRSKSKAKKAAPAEGVQASAPKASKKTFTAAPAKTTDLSTIRDAITTLTGARGNGASAQLTSAIDDVLVKAVRQYGETLFPSEKIESKSTNGAVAQAPVISAVAPAPVAFNPPTPFVPQS